LYEALKLLTDTPPLNCIEQWSNQVQDLRSWQDI
jgi:hypothetical protein